MKKIRLLFTFYGYFMWASLAVDAACMILLFRKGIGIYSMLFYLKIFTMAASLYFVNEYKKEEYFYFYNVGLSKKTLWITTLAFDLFLFFILMILTYQLR